MRNHTFKILCIMTFFCLGLVLALMNISHGQVEAHLKAQMQRKLENTKLLMAGLALNDAARIKEGTQGLLSTCDALGWTRPGKAEFEDRDRAFHDSVKRLSHFVGHENYDAARVQFIEMVVLCMDCHGIARRKE